MVVSRRVVDALKAISGQNLCSKLDKNVVVLKPSGVLKHLTSMAAPTINDDDNDLNDDDL